MLDTDKIWAKRELNTKHDIKLKEIRDYVQFCPHYKPKRRKKKVKKLTAIINYTCSHVDENMVFSKNFYRIKDLLIEDKSMYESYYPLVENLYSYLYSTYLINHMFQVRFKNIITKIPLAVVFKDKGLSLIFPTLKELNGSVIYKKELLTQMRARLFHINYKICPEYLILYSLPQNSIHKYPYKRFNKFELYQSIFKNVKFKRRGPWCDSCKRFKKCRNELS